MYDINRSIIKELLQKYKKREPVSIELEDVIEAGLRHLYGCQHLKSDGKIVPCHNKYSESLLKGSAHICSDHPFEITVTPLGIPNIKEGKFVNRNLGLLGKDERIYGYYYTNRVFNQNIHDEEIEEKEGVNITTMEVTEDKFYLGTTSGDLIFWDFLTNGSISQPRHSKAINKVHKVNNEEIEDYVISCSEDGTIFLNESIKVSSTGILDAISIEEGKYFFCTEDQMVGYCYEDDEDEEKKYKVKYWPHSDKIEMISQSKSQCISSSADGYFGFFNFTDISFNLKFLDCSKHKVNKKSPSLLGWGRSKVLIYDLEVDSIEGKIRDTLKVDTLSKIITADISISNNIIGYGIGNILELRDYRSSCINSIKFKEKIIKVEISDNDDLIYVKSENDCYILDVRRI